MGFARGTAHGLDAATFWKIVFDDGQNFFLDGSTKRARPFLQPLQQLGIDIVNRDVCHTNLYYLGRSRITSNTACASFAAAIALIAA